MEKVEARILTGIDQRGGQIFFVVVVGAPFILLLTIVFAVFLLPSNNTKDLIGRPRLTWHSNLLMWLGDFAGSYVTLSAAHPGPGNASLMSWATRNVDLWLKWTSPKVESADSWDNHGRLCTSTFVKGLSIGQGITASSQHPDGLTVD